MIFEYNFNSNIEGFAILYFYAAWSSKCNLHQDVLKRIDNENKDVSIYKVNTTKFPHMKQKFSIHKIPSYVIINEGNVLSRVDGYTDAYSLSRWVKKNRV